MPAYGNLAAKRRFSVCVFFFAAVQYSSRARVFHHVLSSWPVWVLRTATLNTLLVHRVLLYCCFSRLRVVYIQYYCTRVVLPPLPCFLLLRSWFFATRLLVLSY